MSDILVAHSYAGSTSERYTLRKYSSAGVLKWSASHGLNITNTDVFSVAVDSDGNVFCGGISVTISSVPATIRKYDSNGTEQGSPFPLVLGNGDSALSLAVDSNDNLFVTTTDFSSTSSLQTRKYLADGTLSWSINYSRQHNACAIDSSGNVLIASNQDGTVSALKYTNTGSFVFSRNHGTNLRAVCIDSADNYYFGGDRYFQSPNYYTARKYSSSGAIQWSRDLHGAPIRGIAVDGDGNVYVAGNRISNVTTRKYNSSGTLLWSADHGDQVNAIAIDPSDGYIYTAGVRTSNITVRKYAPDGTEVTTGWPIDTGNTAYAIAFSEIAALSTDVPALALAYSLAVPLPTATITIPSLPLRFALAAPISSDPPEPPLGDGQTIYRLWIATGAILQALPIASIQCRRRRGNSTWLVVDCPGVSQETAEWLQSVIGAAITIDSGLRDSAGTETIGLFLRAYLTEVNHSQTPAGGNAVLTCRVDAINETLQTRALEGVTDQIKDGGKWLLRCGKVNHRLRPGDTATYGALSFTVNAVRYQIAVNSTWMEVEE